MYMNFLKKLFHNKYFEGISVGIIVLVLGFYFFPTKDIKEVNIKKNTIDRVRAFFIRIYKNFKLLNFEVFAFICQLYCKEFNRFSNSFST